MGKLDGRVALVTAGGSGMGRSACRLFASEGAMVLVVDIDQVAAGETVDLIRADGGSADGYTCDVSNVESLRALFDAVCDRYDALHVLYNHAGIPGGAGLDLDEADWDRAMAVNCKSAFFATKFALPLLKRAAPHASVIYTSSASGIVGSAGSPVYAMAKGGVILLAKSVAIMHGKDGIRANAICPGPTATPMLATFFGRDSLEGALERAQGFADQLPLRRVGTPDEVAAAALFLASDDSSYITGVALPVDGGHTAQ